jgi:hypothetical protein
LLFCASALADVWAMNQLAGLRSGGFWRTPCFAAAVPKSAESTTASWSET